MRNRYFSDNQIDWWSIISEDLWSGEEHRDGISSFYRPIFLSTVAFDFLLVGLSTMVSHSQSNVASSLCHCFVEIVHQLN